VLVSALMVRTIARLMKLPGPRVLALVLLSALSMIPSWPSVAAPLSVQCRSQRPQAFLMRSSYVKHGVLDGAAHLKAVHYRVEKYGTVEGAPREGRSTAASMALQSSFFGHPVRLNRRIVPALQCVEQRIEQRCSKPKDAYYPKNVGGLRETNTIRGGEISNHLFGIAIDIDPNRNACCHCVGNWKKDPKCAKQSQSPFDHSELTHCWVDAFEHFGFYWLGRDTLEDTMHFEFLGNPDRIIVR